MVMSFLHDDGVSSSQLLLWLDFGINNAHSMKRANKYSGANPDIEMACTSNLGQELSGFAAADLDCSRG